MRPAMWNVGRLCLALTLVFALTGGCPADPTLLLSQGIGADDGAARSLAERPTGLHWVAADGDQLGLLHLPERGALPETVWLTMAAPAWYAGEGLYENTAQGWVVVDVSGDLTLDELLMLYDPLP